MYRSPAWLTMIEPGRLRSARQNHGPFGQRDGRAPPGVVQQVGLGARGDAGEDAAAGVELRAGRPVDRGRLRLVLLAHLQVLLEAAAAEDDAAAGADRRWSRRRGCTSYADDPAVLERQPGQLGVVGDRDVRRRSGPCAGRSRSRCPSRTSCGAARRLTTRLEQDLGHRHRAAPGAQTEADLPEVGLRDDHVRRRLGVLRVQPVELVAEEARVQRDRLAGAARGAAAGRLRVVVGVLRDPLEATGVCRRGRSRGPRGRARGRCRGGPSGTSSPTIESR